MAEGWRGYAERGEWGKITMLGLSRDDAEELAAMLRDIVPRRQRGHGVETFDGWILPREAANFAGYWAADCLERVEEWLWSLSRPKHPFGQVFRPAVEEAIRTIGRETGLDYQGMRDTYLFHGIDGGLCQLPQEIGRAIIKRRDRLLFNIGEGGDANAFLRWQNLYPWRRCISLIAMWRSNVFEYNSPMDHALHILNFYEMFREDFMVALWGGKTVGFKGGGGRVQRAHSALNFAELGFEIGRHYEALLKKPYEEHAVARMETVRKNRQNGKGGGQAGTKRQRLETLNRLASRAQDRFAFASDTQFAREAKALAERHEAEARDGLFRHAGKPLSLGWFEKEWVPQFRDMMRAQQEQRLVKN